MNVPWNRGPFSLDRPVDARRQSADAAIGAGAGAVCGANRQPIQGIEIGRAVPIGHSPDNSASDRDTMRHCGGRLAGLSIRIGAVAEIR